MYSEIVQQLLWLIQQRPVLGNSATATKATSADKCTGNSATATKLQTARKINITGGVKGSASFDGSKDVNIDVSIAKSVADYLYLITYTNNSKLINSVKGISTACTDFYLVHGTSKMQTYAGYYFQQVDSLCINAARYLYSLLPTSNTYRTALGNCITNLLDKYSYTEMADLATSQRITLTTTSEGTATTSTLLIKSNNYSLPNLIAQIRKSL